MGLICLIACFLGGGQGYVFAVLLLFVHIFVMVLRGWLLVLGEFFGESVSKKGLYMRFY